MDGATLALSGPGSPGAWSARSPDSAAGAETAGAAGGGGLESQAPLLRLRAPVPDAEVPALHFDAEPSRPGQWLWGSVSLAVLCLARFCLSSRASATVTKGPCVLRSLVQGWETRGSSAPRPEGALGHGGRGPLLPHQAPSRVTVSQWTEVHEGKLCLF